jgi:sorbitol-specific phosphotransferase system component IIBC
MNINNLGGFMNFLEMAVYLIAFSQLAQVIQNAISLAKNEERAVAAAHDRKEHIHLNRASAELGQREKNLYDAKKAFNKEVEEFRAMSEDKYVAAMVQETLALVDNAKANVQKKSVAKKKVASKRKSAVKL